VVRLSFDGNVNRMYVAWVPLSSDSALLSLVQQDLETFLLLASSIKFLNDDFTKLVGPTRCISTRMFLRLSTRLEKISGFKCCDSCLTRTSNHYFTALEHFLFVFISAP